MFCCLNDREHITMSKRVFYRFHLGSPVLICVDGKKICLFVILGFLFILNQGYWEETTETLSLVIASAVVCMVVGVPLGVFAAHHPNVSSFLRPILDLMQTIPTFVYLIPALILFGLGMVPGLIATVIFALPAPIRLTELGVKSTPQPLIEAGKAFGATPRQLLWKIELPYLFYHAVVFEP